jgi:hypothetical protein
VTDFEIVFQLTFLISNFPGDFLLTHIVELIVYLCVTPFLTIKKALNSSEFPELIGDYLESASD